MASNPGPSHSGGNTTGGLAPTFIGEVYTTFDALVLFEACLSGKFNHCPRRPHDRERAQLIKSGHIFVYEEESSGIKRWTDGVNWSPSRILNNFLVYREIIPSNNPGEKKRALKNKSDNGSNRRSQSGGIVKKEHSPPSSHLTDTSRLSLNTNVNTNGDSGTGCPGPSTGAHISECTEAPRDPLREIIGSLTDSYDFKEPDGLVKKTISIKYNNINHHLVSYYTIEDALSGKLRRPSRCQEFCGLRIRAELLFQQQFRASISDFGGEAVRMADGRHYIPAHFLQVGAQGPQISPDLNHPFSPSGAAAMHMQHPQGSPMVFPAGMAANPMPGYGQDHMQHISPGPPMDMLNSHYAHMQISAQQQQQHQAQLHFQQHGQQQQQQPHHDANHTAMQHFNPGNMEAGSGPFSGNNFGGLDPSFAQNGSEYMLSSAADFSSQPQSNGMTGDSQGGAAYTPENPALLNPEMTNGFGSSAGLPPQDQRDENGGGHGGMSAQQPFFFVDEHDGGAPQF